MADVNLTGDARSLVGALEQASAAFINFGTATARITRDVAKLDADGNILSRTLTAVDAAGNKLTGTVEVLESGLAGISGVTATAAEGFAALATTTTAAAEAQALLAEAAALNVDVVISEINVLQQAAVAARNHAATLLAEAAAHRENAAASTSAIGARSANAAAARKSIQAEFELASATELEAASARAAELAILGEVKALELRARAGAVTTQGQNAAALSGLNEEQAREAGKVSRKAEADARALRERRAAEFEKFEKQERASNAKSNADFLLGEKRKTDAVIAENAKRVAEFAKFESRERAANKSSNAEHLASEKKKTDAVIAESAKRASEFAKFETRERAANARSNADHLASEKKKTDAVIAENAKRAAEFEKFEARERAANAKSNAAFNANEKKKTALFLAEIKKRETAELEALRIRQAGALPTRAVTGAAPRTVAEGGIASKQQVQGFLQAEVAVKKLVTTGKVGFAEMNAAITQARSSTLLLSEANTIAQQSALRLVAAENQVAAGAQKAAASTRGLGSTVKNLGNLIGISLLIGGAFRLVQAFVEATTAAGELSIKLAEIETITKDNAFATESWAQGLQALSAEFGIDTLTQAEGAYQILSNQIRNASGAAIQGAEALDFLRTANQLAITGVTDTAAATNLLTATINGFQLSSEDAGIAAAQLFKVVELGRVRIEDMSESFGRLVVPANQLGLTLAEVGGAIAQATIQGVKFNEASTLVRNVILKLIRPTDVMRGVFDKLGVASGEALIAQQGFVGALSAIESQVGGTSSELGEAFGRIRAITGALIFAGDGAAEAAEKIKEIRETTQASFSADTNRIIQTTGQQLKIAGAEAAVFFERQVGTPALKAIARWIKSVGGMGEVLEDTTRALGTFIKVSGVAFGAAALAKLSSFLVGLGSIEAAILAAEKATIRWGLALLLTPVGAVAAIGTALVAASELILDASEDSLRASERANATIARNNKDLNSKILSAEKAATAIFKVELDRRTQAVLQVFGRARAELSKTSAQLVEESEVFSKKLSTQLAEFRQVVSTQLSGAKKALSEFNKTVENAAKLTTTILNEIDQSSVKIDLDTAGTGQQIELLNREIAAVQEAVAQATEEGNLKQFQIDRKRVNSLLKTKIDSEIKFARRVSTLEAELESERLKQQLARRRGESSLADDRIADIERELQIVKNGTAVQLQQEQRLQAAREQARTATTAVEFEAALISLNAIEDDQGRINELAAEEVRLRDQATKALERQAKQSEEIRRINEERAKVAREEEQRIRSLQFLFNLVSKDAELFKDERIVEGKTAKEINEAVAEQQKRLAQLITLSRELSGSNAADAIFRQREEQLRAQAANRIATIEKDAQTQRLIDIRDELQERLKNSRQVQRVELSNLQSIQQRISAFLEENRQGRLSGASTETGAFSRGATLAGAFNQRNAETFDPGLRQAGATSFNSLLAARFDKQIKLAEQLNDIILQQRTDPSGAGRLRIASLTESLKRGLGPLLADGLAEVARIRADATPGAPGTAGGNIPQSTIGILGAVEALLGGLGKLPKSLDDLNKNQAGIRGFLELLPQVDPKSTEKSILDALKASRLAQRSPEEVAASLADEFRRIDAGARVTEGPIAVPGAVQPAALGSILSERTNVLSDKTAEEIAKGLETGAKQAAPAVNKVAEATGKTQARAAADETIKQAPALEARLDAIRRRITERRGQLGAAAVGPAGGIQGPGGQIDTSIIIGDARLSIAEQEARIQEEITAATEQRLKFSEAELNTERKLAELKAAAVEGTTGVDDAGQLVTRGRGNINEEGQLVGRRAVDPTLEARLDKSESQIDPVAQALALEALRFGRGGGVQDLNLIKIQEDALANAENTVAKFESIRVLDEERNRILAAQQGNFAAAQTPNTPTGLQGSLDKLDKTIEAFTLKVTSAPSNAVFEGLAEIFGKGFAAGGPVSGPGGTDNVPAMLTSGEFVVRKSQAQKFFPQLLAMNAGTLRPRGFQDGGPVDVGGINVVVNESSNPQATTRQVVAEINRGLRIGTIKLRRS